ncbi:MAG: hypothetical protein LBE44_09590, partial [Microbacterium hominis]|nr:hypothetical protein [Microbacterium hominis]
IQGAPRGRGMRGAGRDVRHDQTAGTRRRHSAASSTKESAVPHHSPQPTRRPRRSPGAPHPPAPPRARPPQRPSGPAPAGSPCSRSPGSRCGPSSGAFGRRRPWAIGGVVLGSASLVGIAFAQSPWGVAAAPPTPRCPQRRDDPVERLGDGGRGMTSAAR